MYGITSVSVLSPPAGSFPDVKSVLYATTGWTDVGCRESTSAIFVIVNYRVVDIIGFKFI